MQTREQTLSRAQKNCLFIYGKNKPNLCGLPNEWEDKFRSQSFAAQGRKRSHCCPTRTMQEQAGLLERPTSMTESVSCPCCEGVEVWILTWVAL